MHIICLQENLSNALLLASRVVSQKIQLPILSNILLTASKNTFNIKATDLELSIKLDVPAKIEKEGEITVPAKTIYEFVSTLGPGQLELTTEGQTLRLKTKNQNASFLGVSALEFPKFDTTKQQGSSNITKGIIKSIIKNISFSAANDDIRPVLSGVLFKSEDGFYCFVATDGYRLSFKKIENKANVSNVFIVPSRAIKELGFLVEKTEDSEDSIGIFPIEKESQIKFVVGDNVLISRLIEGEFPSYNKIIPQSSNTTVTFDREDFLSSVKTAAVMARDSANIIKLKVEKGNVLVSANAPQVGENTSVVEAKTTGDENEIAFNSRFLLEFLGSVEGKELIFEMTGPLNPGVFRIANDNSFFHIIMPVRVQD